MQHKSTTFSYSKKQKKAELEIASRILIFFVAMFFPIAQTFAMSIDENTLHFYSKNNILYYDPTGTIRDCNNTLTTKPSGSQITWIGDSYTEGAKAIIEEKLPGVDIYSQGSKHFGLEGEGIQGGKSGLSILKELNGENKIRGYIVFALGTNDPDGINNGTNGYLNQVLDIVGEKPIILVTPKTAQSTDFSHTIQQMKDAVNSHSNIIIADWAANGYREEFFQTDKQHPYDNGGLNAWFEVIYNSLPSSSISTSGSNGIIAGSTNAEKVWTYFATAGIPGISDNPATIAGIVGNLHGESGLDPFIKAYDGSGSYVYGLYQTYAYREGYDPEFGKMMDNAGLNRYWHTGYTSTAPEEAVDTAIKLQLDYLVTKHDRFKGTGWAEKFGFLNHTSNIKANTPEGYSDLFVIAVEGAVTSRTVDNEGESNYIEDPDARQIGIASFGSQKGGGKYYQSAGRRRRFSRQFYNQFLGISGPAYTSSSSGALNCYPVSADAGDALSYLQQYVRDINYFYDANAPMPTTSAYFNINDPKTYTAPMPRASTLNQNHLQQYNLPQSTKDKISSYSNCFGGATCRECTALSGWFVTMFTKYKYYGGHGKDVVTNLVANNSELTLSNQPTPWSIFSYSGGSYGHTGIVIEVLDSGEIITLENNLGYNNGNNSKRILAIVKTKPNSSYVYTDLRGGLDTSHLGTSYEK